MESVREMWKSNKKKVDYLRSMVENLIKKKEERKGFVQGWNISDIEVKEEMSEEEKEMIEEGGYLSVEYKENSLLDFDVEIYGGKKDSIEVIRDEVKSGFEKEESMFGGELKEIRNKKIEEVMNGFDEWEEYGYEE